MTEAEWFYELQSLRFPTSDRKALLFAVACCRRASHVTIDPRHLTAIEAAEQLADGAFTEEALGTAIRPIIELWRVLPPATQVEWDPEHYMTGATRHLTPEGAVDDASFAARALARTAGVARSSGWTAARYVEGLAQRVLIQDIVRKGPQALPFNSAWRTSTAVAIACGMYDSRDFSPMPILAYALQDAGCENDDILDHCRGPGPHVRGCWVVDLVLGKE